MKIMPPNQASYERDEDGLRVENMANRARLHPYSRDEADDDTGPVLDVA